MVLPVPALLKWKKEGCCCFDCIFLQISCALVCINPRVGTGNPEGGSIIVQLTSCLTCLDLSVLRIKMKIVSCHTADCKPQSYTIRGNF
jgi:hypothetical protein